MNDYLFHHEVYQERYNCSALTEAEWLLRGQKHEYFGIFSIVLGCFQLMFYLPFFITMLEPQLFVLSCYKLMFFLGFVDILTIIIASIVSGYLMIQGAVYCSHPTLNFCAGAFGLATWLGSCYTCMLLTINRCTDVYFPHISRALFNGWRTWVWIGIPASIMFYVTMYAPVMTFNSNYMAWFFDPYIGMDDIVPHDPLYYTSKMQSFSNVLTIIVLFVGNAFLFYYVHSKTAKATGGSKMKKQFATQVFVICFLVMSTASIYTYMQYFSAPKWLIIIASMSFCFSSGKQ
uniref:Serpentine Receptor, class T n=1 Tax=Ditylenchus dipsaci TaxID=166011 RepID=A0A915CND9_9BILA